MSITKVSPREAWEHVEEIELIDVRTPAEFEEVHARGARLLPLDELNPERFVQERNGHGGEPVYLVCRSGDRAAKAADRLERAGLREIRLVEGGTQAWEEAGLPVERGRRMVSLERQVRIAAGSLVVLGAVLGWLIHPALHVISAFVGAGLVFAGVTNTCGMAMVLARLPWNRRRGSCGADANAKSSTT